MKSLLRSGPVSSLLGYLIWGYMVLINRTVRWRIEGDSQARGVFAEGNGALIAGWHSRVMLLPVGWTRHIRHWPGLPGRRAMLISLSADGEPVAKAIRHLGLEAVRGSKSNRNKRDKDKGGARAIAESVQILRTKGALCITPDGPRGPAEEVSLGAVLLSVRSGAAIVPYALSVAPAKRLNTWDGFVIPLPFSRGAIVYGDAVRPTEGKRPQDIQRELQDALDRATRRADALAARGSAQADTLKDAA